MNVAATTTRVEHLEGTELQKSRSYSPAIVTMGGKIVWLAGQTALEDLNGRSIEHDFERQTRTCFELIGRTLAQAGGNLKHLVTMTVYLSDGRYGDRFVAIRKEFFPNGKSLQRLADDFGLRSPRDDDRDTGRRGHSDLGWGGSLQVVCKRPLSEQRA